MNPVRLISIFFVMLLLGHSSLYAAEEKPLPISIEADKAEIDDRNQISIYTGNVVVKQGGMTLHADTLTVYTVQRELDRIRALGNPATYERIQEGEEDIRGHSKQLDYDANTRILVLTTDAELWQGEDRFRGERIQYDQNNEKVIAHGAAGDNNGQRVHIILQPKSDTDDKNKKDTSRP